MAKGMKILFLVMLISLVIAFMWDSVPAIKQSVESVLDPTFGALLSFNFFWGFIIITAILALILSLIQKYTTDQEALRELKKEQKILQQEMKKYREHPEKLLALQKKQLEFIPKTFDLTMKPLLFTSIPIILLFRWFSEILHPVWGGWWILYYILASMIFSTIFRKMLKIA